MPDIHHLFSGRYGGLIDRPEKDAHGAHLLRTELDVAESIGLVTVASAAGTGWNATVQPWWNAGLEGCDQGQLGACVSFAGSRAREVLSLQAGHPWLRRSELWAYHEMQRKFLPTQVGQDTGAYGAWYETIVAGRGTAYEADLTGYPKSGYPYADNTAALAAAPPSTTYGPALFNTNIVAVAANTSLPTMKALLAAGHCVLVGYVVCASLEAVAQGTGNVPVPVGPDPVLGGHENLRIGFQDSDTYPNGVPLPRFAGGQNGYWIHLNSWVGFSPRNLLYVPYAFDSAPSPNGSGPMLMDAVCFALAKTA